MTSVFWMKIAGLVCGADLLMKHSIEEKLSLGETRPLANGKVELRKVHNKGAVLNLLENDPELVKRMNLTLGGATLLYDAILLRKKGTRLKKLGMMLFTGGALSNIWDRIMRGYVVDYIGLNVPHPKLSGITYNLGDFAIFIGSILSVITKSRKTPVSDQE